MNRLEALSVLVCLRRVLVVLLVVFWPKVAAAHELRCLLEAMDQDDLEDCIGVPTQPIVRVAATTAVAPHVESLWLEAGARPWTEDASHRLRHLWITAALPVSAVHHDTELGNSRVGLAYEDDTLRGLFALTLPTAHGDPQSAAAAAWGYERNPSFAVGRFGLTAGVDLDTDPDPLRVGVSLHAHALVGSGAAPSAFEVLPETRIAWSPWRLPPYERFRGVTLLLLTWSDVRFDSSTHAALLGEARLVTHVDRLHPLIGVIIPIATSASRAIALHSGIEASF